MDSVASQNENLNLYSPLNIQKMKDRQNKFIMFETRLRVVFNFFWQDSLILVNIKQANSVKAWKLRECDNDKWYKIANKMSFGISSVETSQQKQNDRKSCKKFLLFRPSVSTEIWWYLFVMCLSFTVIDWCNPRSSLQYVQEEKIRLKNKRSLKSRHRHTLIICYRIMC